MGKIKTFSTHVIQTHINSRPSSVAARADKEQINKFLGKAEAHCEQLAPEYKDAAGMILQDCFLVNSQDFDVQLLTTIHNMAVDNFDILISIEAHVKLKKFKEHLYQQLRKGGGTLHK